MSTASNSGLHQDLLVQGNPPTLGSVGSEGERSEPERTTGPNVGERRPPPPPGQSVYAPNPEVVDHATRRRFTAEYKQRILAEVDAATDPGAIGLITRREGLYASHLTHWRKARDKGELEALEPKKRGPKRSVKDPLQAENAKLTRENARLNKKLQRAELIIDLQKKVSQILGITLPILQEENDDEVNS